jgi:site-specific recombinase XerD
LGFVAKSSQDNYMPERRGLFEVAWMRRYVKFHCFKHPREMGVADIEAFLTHLAVAAKVAASTQNQALQALLFLYRQVLGVELPWLDNVTRASRPKRLPVVLSAAEVRTALARGDAIESPCWRRPLSVRFASILRSCSIASNRNADSTNRAFLCRLP